MFQFPSLFVGASRLHVTLAAVTFASFAGVSYAQHDDAASAAASATASLAPLRFDSVLSRYKPMTDQKLGSWREANDTVTRIGGWRTYLKEAQTPAKTPTAAVSPGAPLAPATADTPSPTPAVANPHAGHGGKP